MIVRTRAFCSLADSAEPLGGERCEDASHSETTACEIYLSRDPVSRKALRVRTRPRVAVAA